MTNTEYFWSSPSPLLAKCDTDFICCFSPSPGIQVLPALVCFCDAGDKEEGAKDKRHDPTVNKGSLHLISQGGSQIQGGLEVICEERRTKDAWLQGLVMIFNQFKQRTSEFILKLTFICSFDRYLSELHYSQRKSARYIPYQFSHTCFKSFNSVF